MIDRFDKLAAIYVFCMHYHSGQWSRFYRLMCRIEKHYKLKLSDNAMRCIQDELCDYTDEWIGARSIYNQLVEKYGS